MKFVFIILIWSLTVIDVIKGLSVTQTNLGGWDTLPGGSPSANLPGNSIPRFYQDGKWPAYAWDAPANYHVYGKSYADNWLFPGNVPRWYNQPDANLFQGTAGYLNPPFYSNPGSSPYFPGNG